MSYIWFFLLGVFFTALGALPPGMINLSVAERSIQRGFNSGIMVALGAAVTEFVYTFVSIYFIDTIIKNEVIGSMIKWTMVFVFFILGTYYLIKKVEAVQTKIAGSGSRDFGYGIVVAAMNMLIIPTWIVIGLWMRGNGFDFVHISEILLISLGSALGGFIVFAGYVRLGRFIVNRMEKVTRYTNRFLGAIFLGLATVQLLRIFYDR
ncbi:MAG: LysE family transporter [Saprospiraceae bacterium]|nr:LysE family transporter [Saprospiraceae bacterium]